MKQEDIKKEILIQSDRLMPGEVLAKLFIEKRLNCLPTEPYWLIIDYFHTSLHTSPTAGVMGYFSAIQDLVYSAEYFMNGRHDDAAKYLKIAREGINIFQEYLNWDYGFVINKLVFAHIGAAHLHRQVCKLLL